MATKFYLHRGATADTGTLPAAGVSLSVDPLTQIASGGGTNRVMDTTIGVSAQTSQVLTTNANQTSQSALLARFVSAPIGAQTFANGASITFGGAISESNANSNFFCGAKVFVWRPSAGSLVGAIYDSESTNLTQATTAEAWSTEAITTFPGAVTSLNNDIIVCEIWRETTAQSMSTAYTNSFFYDGITEASATNAASFLNFATTVTFATAATPSLVVPARTARNSLLRR